MITANTVIFTALDQFCASRGLVLQNSGKPRWIASEPKHRHFLINAVVGETISFSMGRKLARFDLSTKSFLCAVGFDQESLAAGTLELDLDPAFLTVALCELQPRPVGSVSDVRQVVEIADKEADSSYTGHSFEAISGLFPSIRFFDVPFRASGQTWSAFFRTCIDECGYGPSWINDVLAEILRSMCDLEAERIPYQVLCRSVFNDDPSSFFLAQYRCLEALYAYSSAKDLINSLDIKKSWVEVATVLEDKLGWHPREEGSLTRVLNFASHLDLKSLLDATNKAVNAQDGIGLRDDVGLVIRAAKRIYWLRNSIVHFRPAQHRLRIEVIDWISACQAMAGIIVDVYYNVSQVNAHIP